MITEPKAHKKVQQIGIPQEISDGTFIAGANLICPFFHFDFCNNDQKYPECGNHSQPSVHSMEYILISNKPAITISLKNRLNVGIPVCSLGVECNVLGKVNKPMKNAKCIIHNAKEVCGKITGQVESMHYCLTVLDKHVMVELMTHMNKKIKWVFDETIIHKVGLVELSSIYTLSQEIQGGCTLMSTCFSLGVASSTGLMHTHEYLF